MRLSNGFVIDKEKTMSRVFAKPQANEIEVPV